MFRRPARLPKSLPHLFLACAVLTTQTAGVGFCGGDESLEPTGRAHFHVAPLLHQPAACGHCHHEAEAEEPTTWAEPGPGHDADAVYVASEDGLSPEGRVAAVWAPARLTTEGVVGSRTATRRGSRPDPGLRPPTCPTYLRHLALLL